MRRLKIVAWLILAGFLIFLGLAFLTHWLTAVLEIVLLITFLTKVKVLRLLQISKQRKWSVVVPDDYDTKVDVVIVSDIHLGNHFCQIEKLLRVLDCLDFKTIILNGDIFDHLNLNHLEKNPGVKDFLKKIRHFQTSGKGVIWIAGNHDGPVESLSTLMGIEAVKEYSWSHGGKRFLATHGDIFDPIINEGKKRDRTRLASWFYQTVLRPLLDSRGSLTYWAMETNQTWNELSDTVANKALAHAQALGFSTIFCGHVHIARQVSRQDSDGVVSYYNSGCWLGLTHLITILDNQVKLIEV